MARTGSEDITFSAAAGEHLALVGPNGAGKTTLVSLLLQFYRPQQGEILFDGRPAGTYELHALRRRIGYVPQSPTLLAGTIEANLRYGDPEAGQAQVEEAARTAGIHEFIASLPLGYQALVGERGINFSEGQKQRLAIARPVKNSDIVVLDEPTSSWTNKPRTRSSLHCPRAVRQDTLSSPTAEHHPQSDCILLNDKAGRRAPP
jgi:ABC-type multidrug transport system fused ATPase/permease subunit